MSSLFSIVFGISIFAVVIANAKAETTVLFLGDSLTSGYGIAKEEAYPSLIKQLADQNGVPLKIINAGMSGDTSAGGLRRLSFYLSQPIDVFVLALGANDGLRGLDPEIMEKNLREIITKVRAASPEVKILLVGMEAPPNMGAEYVKKFREAYTRIAATEKVALLPFLLEGVAGESSLNLSDRMHPNEAGHKIISQLIWKALEPLVKESSQ